MRRIVVKTLALTLGSTLGLVGALGGTVSASNVVVLEEVGTLEQSCPEGAPAVTTNMANEMVRIAPGDEAEVALPVDTSEFVWYCGEEQRVAGNNVFFNHAVAERDDSGEISWTFMINWSK